MHHALLNPYQNTGSILHRLPPGGKLLAAIIFVISIALTPRDGWVVYGVTATALATAAILSRITLKEWIRKLIRVEPFALGAALLTLPQQNGSVIFANVLAKSSLCLFCMLLLSSTTRFTEMLDVLRRAHVPSLLVTTLALMHRYIFVLINEMGRLSRARKSRTYVAGKRAVWKSSATVVALLFVRASERAERIYAAMCARGWKT